MSAINWAFLGVGLLLLEAITPGFVWLFFGLAALVVALLTWCMSIPVWVQWLLFSVFSVVSLVLLRKALRKIFVGGENTSDDIDDEFVGKRAKVVEAVGPNRPGRVEFKGCSWAAESDEDIPAGATARICSKENITLFVKRV